MPPIDHECMAAIDVFMPVRVFGGEVAVFVRHDVGVERGPQPQRRHGADRGDPSHAGECRRYAHTRAELPDKRVANQPADVAERELRGEKRGPVLGISRTPQQTTRRRDAR